jgi:ribulose-phosphate 3-epimerase
MIHYDVMDGHFVNALSFGVDIAKMIANATTLKADIHLMVDEPLKHILECLKFPFDIITFHYEACKNDEEVIALLSLIRAHKHKAGLSIKPNTPVEAIIPFLHLIDVVLVMLVEPGLGGQLMQVSCIDKIAAIRKLNKDIIIEGDGGINNTNIKLLAKKGLDIAVVGSYITKAEDIEGALNSLL